MNEDLVFKLTTALACVVKTPGMLKLLGIDHYNTLCGLALHPRWPYTASDICQYCSQPWLKGHQRSCLAIEGPDHMCGLSGYSPFHGDTCPRCDWEERTRLLPFEVVREGFTLTVAKI